MIEVKDRVWFNQAHRQVYGEKAIEFSLLTVGGLVLLQLFTGEKISIWFFVVGGILFTVGIVISYKFLHGVRGGGGK